MHQLGVAATEAVNGLFDVAIKGDASATSFTLKAKKLNGTLNHLGGDSTVDVGVLWAGVPVTTTAYSTLIDTAAGINGGNLSPIAQGYTGNMCTECQNFTMVRNGTCEKCDTCGATSGCS